MALSAREEYRRRTVRSANMKHRTEGFISTVAGFVKKPLEWFSPPAKSNGSPGPHRINFRASEGLTDVQEFDKDHPPSTIKPNKHGSRTPSTKKKLSMESVKIGGARLKDMNLEALRLYLRRRGLSDEGGEHECRKRLFHAYLEEHRLKYATDGVRTLGGCSGPNVAGLRRCRRLAASRASSRIIAGLET